MKVVIAGDPWEYSRIKGFGHLVIAGISDEYPVLRAWECLVGAAGDYLDAFPQRVLELATGYQAENMGAVVPDIEADLVQRILQFLDWRREKENGLAEQRDLRLHLKYGAPGPIHIEIHFMRVERISVTDQPPQSHCTEFGRADVRAVGERAMGYRIAMLAESFEEIGRASCRERV